MDKEKLGFRRLTVSALFFFGALAGCSKPVNDGNTPGSGSENQSTKPDYSKLAQNPMQVQAGKKVFGNCAVCHSADPAVPSPAGPLLAGVVGRKIGGVAGFPYSQALADADGDWTPEKLNVFLNNPAKAYPGTAMAFGGLAKQSDRTDVIAYLASTAPK